MKKSITILLAFLLVCSYIGYAQDPIKRPSKKPTPDKTKTSSKVSSPDGYIADHGYVDLGLSVKWATTNIGASTPESYGSYFAWGETSTKSEYTEGNSRKYGKSESQLRSEGIINSQGNLTPSYDAARTNWGGTWRMPTQEEFNELLNNCTWTWTTQGGNNGCKVTGSNGKSIFLPAAGLRNGSSLKYAGECGYYWSSTVSGAAEYACLLYFLSGGDGTDYYYRNIGRTVRPVSE